MTTRPRRCTGDTSTVVVAVAARTALWTAVLLALWAVVPVAFGWHVTTVASDSMAPRITAGDVVAALPVDGHDVQVGQVLLVDDPDRPERLRLHRLLRVEDDGLRLRGDANTAPDTSIVGPDAVHGVGVLRVPWVGAPGMWVRQHRWVPLGIATATAACLVALARLDRDVRRGLPCRRCGATRWDLCDSVAEPAGGSTGTLSVTALALACTLALAPDASAAFTATTSTGSGLGSSVAFPCFRQHDLDGAVLAWDFDEARGTTVRDTSGHGMSGAATAGATRNDASCADNPSMHFSETVHDSRISTTSSVVAPDAVTVEAWFRTDRPGGRVIGFSSSQDPASAYKDRHLYVSRNGRLVMGVQGANTFRYTVGSATPVDDGAWHHGVGVYEAGRLEVWVDGVLETRRNDATDARRYGGYWRVGRESLDPWPDQPTDYTFRGDIDSVRVYDRALSAAEVRQHAIAGR